MITKTDILFVQRSLVDKYGGSLTLRDEKALDFAIKRLSETFGGRIFFETAQEKAAVLVERILTDRPFVDNNERIAYVLLRLLLKMEAMDLSATALDKQHFITSISKGEIKFEAILKWIQANLIA